LTANDLFRLYVESNRSKDTEKQLLERLRLVTLQEVRKRSRGFRLTREDTDDIVQENYFLLLEVLQRPAIEDFEREFVLAIRRYLRHTYKYKKRESLYGESTPFEDYYSIKPDLENYVRIISKISSCTEDSCILYYLVENRIKEKTCTLKQISVLHKVSLDKVFKLERKLKAAIRKDEKEC